MPLHWLYFFVLINDNDGKILPLNRLLDVLARVKKIMIVKTIVGVK